MSVPRSPRPLPTALLALAVTITGLAAAAPGFLPSTVAGEAPTATERALQARPAAQGVDGAAPPYDIDDWFLLSTPRHPDGHYSAFAWRIPTGAVQLLPEGPSLPSIQLEFVTVADGYGAGQDWSLFAFHEDAGEVRLVFAILGPTVQHEDLSATPSVLTTRAPNAGSVVLPYVDDALDDGDTLHFILVGHGDPDNDMAFAFRVAPIDPAYAPAADFDAFVATEPDPPFVPERRGSGSGIYTGYYQELLLPNGPRHRVANDAIEHEHSTLPVPGAVDAARPVDAAIESDAGRGPGWTLAYVSHQAWAEAAHWTLDVAAQGESGRSNGPSLNDPAGASGAVAQRAAGKPLALFMAGGDGESRIRFTVQGADADLGVATYVQHHRLPEPLGAITGVPSATWTDLSRGDSGGLPWIGQLPT